MSYNNYAAPNQGYPPQGYPQSYSQPAYNNAPPPPPQQNYSQQQQQYPQGQYNSMPAAGYAPNYSNAPMQQAYGAPPPNHGYGAPPVQGYPQQQGYGAPPTQGYPPQQGSGGMPGAGYNAPLPPNSNYGPPQTSQQWTPPAPPFDPSYNADFDVESIRKATKGFGTDEKLLIQVLSRKSPAHTLQLSQRFEQLVGKSLVSVIEKETSKWFCFGLVGCAMGPLNWDVHLLHRGMRGLGTHEDILTELIMGRPNAEMNEMKYAYEQKYHKSLQTAVQGELSMKTERAFNMALTARRDEEYIPVDPNRVQTDMQTLYRASSGRMGTDEIAVCGIILSRSDNHLRAISQAYAATHRKTLPEMIRSEFSGHMKDVLLHAVDGAIDRAARDAHLLEEAMKGAGTKDERLTYRIVRMHWNKQHTNTVKAAYRHIYGKDLIKRVQGETSGDYERLLVACLS